MATRAVRSITVAAVSNSSERLTRAEDPAGCCEITIQRRPAGMSSGLPYVNEIQLTTTEIERTAVFRDPARAILRRGAAGQEVLPPRLTQQGNETGSSR